jgi:PAS domain S-box-containing protein
VTQLSRRRRHTPTYASTTDRHRPGADTCPAPAPHPAEPYAVFDAISDIVCITTADGTLRFLNRAGRDLLGYVDDDTMLLGYVVPTHTPAARTLLLDEVIPAALRHGRATGDTALQTADGRVFPAAQTVVVTPSQGDTPAMLTIVIRDISIERQSSKRLAESQRLFEMIARSSPDLMYLYDPGDQRVVWTNRCPHAYLGGEERDARTLSQREIARLVHREDLIPFRASAARIAAAYGDSDVVTCDVRLRTRGGTWRWTQTRASVFSRRETGEALLVLGIASDIGPLKKAEARLIEARDNAERSNQDKNLFLTRLTGELHRSIDGVVGLLSEVAANRDGRLTVREIEQLGDAVDRAVHLRSTVSDLTDYTRMESGDVAVHQRPCDIASLVHETISAFANHPRVASSPVVTRIPTNTAPALVDRARLRQALTHVMAHALTLADDGPIVVRLIAADDTAAPVAIEVEDTHVISDPSLTADAFVPFRMVSRGGAPASESVGTGLGLALTRAICDMIGCSLELVNGAAGTGSAFRITLPRSSRNAQLAGAYPADEVRGAVGHAAEGEKVIPLV